MLGVLFVVMGVLAGVHGPAAQTAGADGRCGRSVARLNRVGRRAGRVVTWVVQPILLVAGGLVMAGQVFAEQFLRSGSAADVEASRIDVSALVDPAVEAFPPWFRAVVWTRFC